MGGETVKISRHLFVAYQVLTLVGEYFLM